MNNSEIPNQYSPDFVGPVLDLMARYNAWDLRCRTYAEMAAEDLLRGELGYALNWAEKHRALKERMMAAMDRELGK